jgi:hypothetical protein
MKKIWSKVLCPGEKWSGNIGRGKYIHFKAMGDNANISMLMYNMRDTSERYNMPDTLKAQYTAYLTTGDILMSDNGRVLASIIEDTCGWHDTISGYLTRKMADKRYGVSKYEMDRNDWLRSGEENFKVELIRNGMGPRDLVPCVNLFAKVYCERDGSMHYDKEHCKKDMTVTLRTEMDMIVILSNTPNILDESKAYPAVPIAINIYEAPPVDLLDQCITRRHENYRAFENTWEYYELLGF